MPLRPLCGLVFTCALLAGSRHRTASAVEYEVFIAIESEEDLYDLRASGQISQRSFDALLLLLQTKVDLDQADRDRLFALPNLSLAQVDRILAMRASTGHVQSLDALVDAGAIDGATARALVAFVIGTADARIDRADGFLRAQSRTSLPDDRLPPASAVQARVRSLGSLDVGLVGVVSRNDVGRIRWDPSRRALATTPERVRVLVPKLYVQWQNRRWGIVAGTYRVGFGQRLTFDVTDQAFPNGFFGDYELRRSSELVLACRRRSGELPTAPCRTDRISRVSPDYQWTNRLTGLAVGAKHIDVGRGWFQFSAWGSYQLHRVLQTEIVDAGACPDPRDDEEGRCVPPAVHVISSGDWKLPASALRIGTLPGVAAEALGGANAAFAWNARARLGVTGYGALPRWRVRGVELGYQETARRPFGGPFGALGVDASYGWGRQDFFAEVTRSFDSQRGGGGGFAALLRSMTDLPSTLVDLSLRYYDRRFANPYARPIAAPDELDGIRARDEVGARLQTTSGFGPGLSLRTIADVWRRVSNAGTRLDLYVRADGAWRRSGSWALWSTYRRTGVPRFTVAWRVVYGLERRFILAAQYQHDWVGTRVPFRQDLAALAQMSIRPNTRFRVRLRVRYDFEDIATRASLAQVLWSYVEAAALLHPGHRVRARYDLRAFLDKRESTARRAPNPEHWLGLEYAYEF